MKIKLLSKWLFFPCSVLFCFVFVLFLFFFYLCFISVIHLFTYIFNYLFLRTFFFTWFSVLCTALSTRRPTDDTKGSQALKQRYRGSWWGLLGNNGKKFFYSLKVVICRLPGLRFKPVINPVKFCSLIWCSPSLAKMVCFLTQTFILANLIQSSDEYSLFLNQIFNFD